MEKWPIGVFASIDAGLGVKLEVAHELGVPTVHLHAPHVDTRTPERADEFLAQLSELGIKISVVFGGFESESYADIPTVAKTVGLVPPETRAARTREMKEIPTSPWLASTWPCIGFVPDKADLIPGSDPGDPGDLRPLPRQRPVSHLETGRAGRHAVGLFEGRGTRQPICQF